VEAVDEEEQLRAEGERARVLVEAGEKRILLHGFEDELRAEPLGEQAGEGRLPGRDRSLDRDQPPRHASSAAMTAAQAASQAASSA
jgi:hypothetical protein